MPRKVPEQKPGKSEQVVCTPPNFLNALKNHLRIDEFSIDLAADGFNKVTDKFYGEEDNSLVQSWTEFKGQPLKPWAFCNPPYGDIRPWVEKAYAESQKGAHVAMLVPASVGSNWWADWVHQLSYVTFLNGRITFVGHKSPYPKDLAILLYAPMFGVDGGYGVWDWDF